MGVPPSRNLQRLRHARGLLDKSPAHGDTSAFDVGEPFFETGLSPRTCNGDVARERTTADYLACSGEVRRPGMQRRSTSDLEITDCPVEHPLGGTLRLLATARAPDDRAVADCSVRVPDEGLAFIHCSQSRHPTIGPGSRSRHGRRRQPSSWPAEPADRRGDRRLHGRC